MTWQRIIGWLLPVMLFFAALPAYSKPAAGPEQFTLKNGMQVVVVPNHRVPAVSHTLWFKVGSADDPQGKSGLAHFLEHLMFKATQDYPAGHYAETIARHGGQQNAFTSYDATGYYVNIAKAHLPLVMELEASRLRGLRLTDEDITKEREVIIEERRQRTDNNPAALLREQMGAALYRHHPYRIPVIGWRHEMETLGKQDALDFLKHYYHPAAAVLIVSGDITAAELKPLAQKYYGSLPAGALPKRHWTAEPPHNAARSVTLKDARVKQREWRRIYMADSFGSGDKSQVLPLFMLAQLLGGGKTSALYESLVVEQKLASSVSVRYNGFSKGPVEFTIHIIPEKGADFAAIETALDQLIARVKDEAFSSKDVTRAKTLLKAESVYARDGLSSMARIMGWIIMSGMPADYFARWPQLIDAVTAKQVQAAAAHALNHTASVTGYLLPEESAP